MARHTHAPIGQYPYLQENSQRPWKLPLPVPWMHFCSEIVRFGETPGSGAPLASPIIETALPTSDALCARCGDRLAMHLGDSRTTSGNRHDHIPVKGPVRDAAMVNADPAAGDLLPGREDRNTPDSDGHRGCLREKGRVEDLILRDLPRFEFNLELTRCIAGRVAGSTSRTGCESIPCDEALLGDGRFPVLVRVDHIREEKAPAIVRHVARIVLWCLADLKGFVFFIVQPSEIRRSHSS